jgi:hypothetical protein
VGDSTPEESIASLETSMKENTTPRVLARLTSEELESVNGGIDSRCPTHATVDLDGRADTGGYTINLGDGTCD